MIYDAFHGKHQAHQLSSAKEEAQQWNRKILGDAFAFMMGFAATASLSLTLCLVKV
jgi:hypothetical protein